MIKNNLKIISALALTGVIALSLTSCSSGAVISPTNASTSNNTIPSKVDKTISENFTIKASVEDSIKSNYNVYNGTYKTFDDEKLKEIFFNGKKDVSKKQIQNSHSKAKDKIQFSSGNTWLTYENGDINYYTKLYDEYSLLIEGTKEFFKDDLDKSFKDSSLAKLNKKEAIDKVKKVSTDLGFDISEPPKVYALDAASLNKLEKENLQ